MTDFQNIVRPHPTNTLKSAVGVERATDSTGSKAVCFFKPDAELWRALNWAQDIGWFATVGEIDLLRAEYRLAKARAA